MEFLSKKENLIKTKMAAIKARDDKLNAELRRLEKQEAELHSKQKLVATKQAAVAKAVPNQSPKTQVLKPIAQKPQPQTTTTTNSVAASASPKPVSKIVNLNKIQIEPKTNLATTKIQVQKRNENLPKPILQSAEKRAKDQNKRISWADSAISSQSPSSNSSDDDVSNLSVRARLKRFETRTLL